MSKKIIDIKTVSRSDEESFDAAILILVNKGYEPYRPVEISFSPTTTSPGMTPGFPNVHGGSRYLTQQFVKYEESAPTVQNIQPSSQEFDEWKKERFCHETSYLNYHLFFNNSECHGKLSLNPDSFILDIYPFQVTEDIGNGAGKAVRKIFKRNS